VIDRAFSVHRLAVVEADVDPRNELHFDFCSVLGSKRCGARPTRGTLAECGATVSTSGCKAQKRASADHPSRRPTSVCCRPKLGVQ
jgi:hypothetical protein